MTKLTEQLSKSCRPVAGASSFTPDQVNKRRGSHFGESHVKKVTLYLLWRQFEARTNAKLTFFLHKPEV